jgi:hypothetical protein
MKEAGPRPRRDSSFETPDFPFAYADSDTLNGELAEWYTYSEEPEFVWNATAFKSTLYKEHYGEKKWLELTPREKKSHVLRLLNQTDVTSKKTRDDVYRSILYLIQGVFQECQTFEDYSRNLVENVILLYECDTFNVFVDILIFEVNNVCSSFLVESKYAPCISDNTDLRVILSILYSLLEVIRCYDIEVSAKRLESNEDLDEKFKRIKTHLRSELNKPLDKTNELLSVYLFQLISKFCNQNIIVLPIKKIILTLWKVLLFTLGGLEDAFNLKNEIRLKFNLPFITENPSVILNNMYPATPPPNPVEIVNDLQFANPNSSYKRKKTSIEPNNSTGLTKQTKGIDGGDEIPFSSANSTTKNSESNRNTDDDDDDYTEHQKQPTDSSDETMSSTTSQLTPIQDSQSSDAAAADSEDNNVFNDNDQEEEKDIMMSDDTKVVNQGEMDMEISDVIEEIFDQEDERNAASLVNTEIREVKV